MKNDLELFSEVYGCYFTVIAKILELAQNGISKTEIEKLVSSNAFYESTFHLLPKLFSGEWNLLKKNKDGTYDSKLRFADTKRPMTNLEKSWVKALLSDKRISLFLNQVQLSELENKLSGVSPLYLQEDFHVFDSAADGDPYEDENYIQNFKVILEACISKVPIHIHYESGKQNELTKLVFPYKINYSGRDDKFRLLGILIQRNERYRGITLNLARIRSLQVSELDLPENFVPEKYFEQAVCSEPIVLEVSKERNALERCMLQFASWEKETEYDEDKDCYICRIFYDRQDETELLIRILSFGPVIKVLAPEGFLKQVKERILKQYELLLIPILKKK